MEQENVGMNADVAGLKARSTFMWKVHEPLWGRMESCSRLSIGFP